MALIEPISLPMDFAALRSQVEYIMREYPPVLRHKGGTWGGWALLSHDGSYRSGFDPCDSCYREVDGKVVFDEERAKEIGFRGDHDHLQPTELCVGPIRDFLVSVEAAGFFPRRARISFLNGGSNLTLHRDAEPGVYSLRLHIPIFTAPDTIFEVGGEKHTLQADGSAYLVPTHIPHQVFNPGPQKRVHLFMNVYDIHHQTKSFPYPHHRSRRTIGAKHLVFHTLDSYAALE